MFYRTITEQGCERRITAGNTANCSCNLSHTGSEQWSENHKFDYFYNNRYCTLHYLYYRLIVKQYDTAFTVQCNATVGNSITVQ